IVDADGRIVAVLLGRPEGDDWDRAMKEVQWLMNAVRRRGVRQGIFTMKNKEHRRGSFFVMRAGVTKGPGQKRPGNLTHSKTYRRLLQRLLANHSVGRIAGFQSSGLARYLPKLYQHQRTTMQGILLDQPELRLPFDNSIFPTVAFNLGPDVVTPEHLDLLNNPYGMCGVTSNGKFDHTRGGHIYLKQLKTVCEFPSGSTVLLLSATCEHGNTSIEVPLFQQLARCIVSPNFRIAERALLYWNNADVMRLLSPDTVPIVIPALHSSRSHWNRSVLFFIDPLMIMISQDDQ
ncbi:hypothetical protein B0H13DRAFT_1588208, partial [Mycena leptocephala]